MYQQSKICLYCVGGSHAGKIFPVEGETIIIGRNVQKCSIVYAEGEPDVSGIHCQIKINEDGIELTDLGSSYGTYLSNGIRLSKNVSQVLKNGEGFCVGNKSNKFIIKYKN